VGIRKILPQTPKLTDTNNIISILQIDALITFTEKDLRSRQQGLAWQMETIAVVGGFHPKIIFPYRRLIC
jgi:hypothetical protein